MGLQSPSINDCINLIKGLKLTFTTFRDNFEKIIRLTEDMTKKNNVENWNIANCHKKKTAF